jgi:enoyl-CoA hydratase/carnithine racemase
MHYEQIATSSTEQVLTITLNRPDKLNAWTQRMEAEFRHAVDAARDDAGVGAIVVTGAGRGFCAGADMAVLEAGAAGKLAAGEAPQPTRTRWMPTTRIASATCCAYRSRSSRPSTGRSPASACA